MDILYDQVYAFLVSAYTMVTKSLKVTNIMTLQLVKA